VPSPLNKSLAPPLDPPSRNPARLWHGIKLFSRGNSFFLFLSVQVGDCLPVVAPLLAWHRTLPFSSPSEIFLIFPILHFLPFIVLFALLTITLSGRFDARPAPAARNVNEDDLAVLASATYLPFLFHLPCCALDSCQGCRRSVLFMNVP